jgi:perosamine synthetase
MTSVVVSDACGVSRDILMERLAAAGIETRPLFYPMHTLPMYREAAAGSRFPVAERVAAGGLSLPSFAGLSSEDVAFVCDKLLALLRQVRS